MKKICTLALGLSLASLLAVPAFADHLNGRIKTVDPAANTITVVEAHQDHVFSVSETTKFLNAKGDALADGIKSGDLVPGARLAIDYKKDKDTSTASEVKLRAPKAKKAPKATPATTEAK